MSARKRRQSIEVEVTAEVYLDDLGLSEDELRDLAKDAGFDLVATGDYRPTSDRLLDLVHERHERERRGPFVCCMDMLCDEVSRNG